MAQARRRGPTLRCNHQELQSSMIERSFVEVRPDSDFPIQNLPYGIFSPKAGGAPRAGVAIGEMVLDLSVLAAEGLFEDHRLRHVFAEPAFNAFMALGRPAWSAARATIRSLLRADNPTMRDTAALRQRALVP